MRRWIASWASSKHLAISRCVIGGSVVHLVKPLLRLARVAFAIEYFQNSGLVMNQGRNKLVNFQHSADFLLA